MTMLNQFPMVHPDMFRKNQLIAKIANDQNWTISLKDKTPMNAVRFFKKNEIFGASFDEGNSLVSLNQLDQHKDFECVNRAYRLCAKKNRIIAIDVEPAAPDHIKKFAFDFPAGYTEISTNGGVHLLIKVPNDIIDENTQYLFDELSIFKEPVEKGLNRQAYYEVMFNDHFITFSKKMVIDKAYTDFETDNDAKTKLYEFLNDIALLDKERQRLRLQMKKEKIEMLDQEISDERKKAIEKFMQIKAFDIARQKAADINPTTFGNDISRYEMSVANSLTYHTRRYYKSAAQTIEFREITKQLKEQDLIYIVYTLLNKTLDYRDKHDEIRDGLPWLLYTAKKSYEYIKTNNKQKRYK